MLKDLTSGIFVTTSKFRKGARAVVQGYAERGVEIALLDGDAFYERLELSRRSPYSRADDESAPYHEFCRDMRSLPELSVYAW